MVDGGSSTALRVQLLGPVRAWRDEEELGLGGPRRRAVLGMLATHAHRSVSRSELIDGIWGQDPPASVVNCVQVYVTGLRRALEPQRVQRAPAQVLIASGPGYQLRLESGGLDAAELHTYLACARQLTEDGDLAAASRSLDAALGLWRGDSLAGVAGPWAEIERVRLEELRQTAICERIDVMLRLGAHHEMLAELARLVREYPLRERIHGQLMLTLYRCGRQAEALAAFTNARGLLAEQLGLDPGPELWRLHQQILTADAALDLPPEATSSGHGAELAWASRSGIAGAPASLRTVPVPRELPADVDTFVGRAAELAELDQMLATGAAAISGSAGVGKTALAVHWGHRARDLFPDGQLYVDLRGYDTGEPVAIDDALAGFLRSLGLADQDIPSDSGERAVRYRSLLDGRRMLIVLDNAAGAEQVRPLLPGVSSCQVLVTSRDSLGGLVARHGAKRLNLDLLPVRDAMVLLRTLIGSRVDDDPGAAVTLAAQCARLPLALRVAAELAAARPAQNLAQLTGELDSEHRRLDLLDLGGDPRTAVRGVFSWSYRHLPAQAARAFRLAGLHPGPDLDAYAAAALVSTDVERAAELLRLLARGHLIQPTAPGCYAMHDLLRAYAAQLAATESSAECHAALARLFDYYLGAAAAAMDTIFPAERNYRPRIQSPATPLPPTATVTSARTWLDTERAVLVQVAAHTASRGWPGHATRLSAILWRHLATGHYIDAITVHTHAHDAARQADDDSAEAYVLNHLGIVHQRLGHYPEAARYLNQALTLFRKLGDRVGEGFALINLGSADRRQGCYPQAVAYGEQALELLREVGDRRGEAHALNEVGLAEWRLGQYLQAAHHFRRARILYRDVRDPTNEAHALGNLGMISGLLGRHSQALDYLKRALILFRGLGYRTGEASTLTDLGSVACREGSYAEATRYQEQALELFREIGERTGEAEALNGLGEVLLAAGQPERAYQRYAAALTLAGQIGAPQELARASAGLGQRPGPGR